jgi:hypothetical protein
MLKSGSIFIILLILTGATGLDRQLVEIKETECDNDKS